MTALETDILAGLICRKHQCLVQLCALGKKQLELIDQGEITALLDVLSVKQRLLAELQRIEIGLDPYRSQAPEERRWPTPEDRNRCAEQLAQCKTLLGEIVSQEKQSEHALIRRRDEAAARLQGAHLAGRARGAYTAQPPGDSNQIDLFSDT